MNEAMRTVFGLLGGLAIFIYGMNMMSEGLQKAAGAKMKYILGILTKNPIIGVLAGAITTAVLQSSSATTVMVIGFVSAGLMSLPQAISVIFGANIGTTMTAQIIAFQIDDYIWPILFIGFCIYFFCKKDALKSTGQSIFAFGLLFLGIQTMGSVMTPLATSPIFISMIEQVSKIPVLGVIVGTAMTVVVQSSSATIAVLQNFAMQPMADGMTSVIGLEGAIPILLGDNIGTTITALLACIGQSKNAKRTAAAHSLFNITGSCIFIWFIPLFARFVRFISPTGIEVEVISRQIANAHTSFNLINTLLFLPFIGVLVKVVMWIVPGEDKEDAKNQKTTIFIDEKITNQPVVALHSAGKEILRMSGFIQEMIANTRNAVINNDISALEFVRKTKENMNSLYGQIELYISNLFSAGIFNEEQAKQATALMYIANDVERISDRCNEMTFAVQMKMEKEYKFSKDAISEMDQSFDIVEEMLVKSIEALSNGDEELAKSVLVSKQKVESLEVKLRKNHAKRLNKGKCTPELTVVFTDILQGIERIGNHCTNIADAVLDDMDFQYTQLDFEEKK